MWSLIPSISSPERVEESLQTRCSDIDLLAQSKSKVIPERFCLHGSLTESYLNSLSGMTSGLSESTTQTPGTTSSGLEKGDRNSPFVAGSRSCVRTSVQQGRVPESQENAADCGQKWRGSLAKYDPVSRSLKTAQLSLIEDLTPSSPTLPRWGSMRNGECYQQPMLAHPISGRESGFWPTPVKSDALVPFGYATMERKEKGECRPSGAKIGSQLTWDRRSLPFVKDGRINPILHQWLMGWPLGWTSFQPLGMDRFREWLQQHSVCSQQEQELSEV